MAQFELTAFTGLFGVLPPALQLPKYEAGFVAFDSLLVNCVILLRWKSHATLSLLLDQGHSLVCQMDN